MKLVIVESPTKAKTISKFLGEDYYIESTYGHIRDLPKSKLGIDIEKNFEPQYLIPRKASKIVKQLKVLTEKADKIILATDEDREGEAIAWHIAQVINFDEIKNQKQKSKTIERIVFHEITKQAIKDALNNPRGIDFNLVDSQQARRILDRLVGYKLSPFLWEKLMTGLSAGRVQSVAVRLIVDREKEIQNFKSEKYWTIIASFLKDKIEFEAILAKINNQNIPLPGIKTNEEAEKIIKLLEEAEFQIADIEKKAVEKKSKPPFTTSTLQQEAWQHLKFSAKQTMMLSQQLYEGINIGKEGLTGLITYMRTDSVNIASEALITAQQFLKKEFSEKYSLSQPRIFKTKSRQAQEAHEGIRPTRIERKPDDLKEYLNPKQYKLYDLIWKRFIASQMPNPVFEETNAIINAKPLNNISNYTFRARGNVLKFDGFLKVYPSKQEEILLPNLSKNEFLKPKKILKKEHETQPPPRYNEASLIKTLEKFGIGRPSTYAPIISTIQERNYVIKDKKRYFLPSEIGEKVNNILVEHFPKIIDINFTAKMEEDLDEIAEGKIQWQPVIKEFYEPFEKNLNEKYKSVETQKIVQPTEEICEKCGKSMVIKFGRFGKFIACSGFPKCKNSKPLPPISLNISCPKCKEGQIVERQTVRRKIFYGCSNYPKCDYATWQKPNPT